MGVGIYCVHTFAECRAEAQEDARANCTSDAHHPTDPASEHTAAEARLRFRGPQVSSTSHTKSGTRVRIESIVTMNIVFHSWTCIFIVAHDDAPIDRVDRHGNQKELMMLSSVDK